MQPNRNLDLADSHHLVFSYDISAGELSHIRIEPYYQLTNALPVENGKSFALINMKDEWFFNEKLNNSGKGRNMGVDLSVEKFMSKGFYYLLTGSVFDSKYRGGDGIWRNTRYNRNFLINLLAGKEWSTGRKRQNLFSINGRVSCQGGDRFTPVNKNETSTTGVVVLNDEKAFQEKLDPSLLLHFNMNYRINKPGHASTWALQIINATGVEDFYGYRINLKNGQAEPFRESIVVPNLSYKIDF